jgi:GTP-binding protein
VFIDQATIKVKAGDGGNGCLSFRREWGVPRGGPDGGNGGKGGDVLIESDSGSSTLLDFQYRRAYRAGRGMHGEGKDKSGRQGADVVIRVPCGTSVFEGDKLLADLVVPGERVVLARGGRGGRGNTAFKSATNRAPRQVEEGQPGQAKSIRLELKLIADVGLVGFPNAGKSTLLRRVSAARPKVADYPFTTLAPYLGTVRLRQGSSFVIADIPGLIRGAHEGKGLGTRFLRHIERTRILLYLLDASRDDPAHDLRVLKEELRCHGAGLQSKPHLIALNKIDLLQLPHRRPQFDRQTRTHRISALTGEGVPALLRALEDLLRGGPPGKGPQGRAEER